MATLSACAQEQGFEVPPVAYTGAISESFRTRDTTDESRLIANQLDTVIDLKSYIWQPWFILLDGGAEVTQEIERGGATGSADSVFWGGNLNVGVLPVSRYPTTLSYSHSDSRSDGSFTGSDFVRDRLGLTSTAIISSELRTVLAASHEIVDQPDFGLEERSNASLSVNKTFDRDRVALDLRVEDATFDSTTANDIDETDFLGTVRYDAFWSEEIATQTTTSTIYTEESTSAQDLNETIVQGTTTAQWRPKEQPFTANAALRMLSENIDVDSSSVSGQRSTAETDRHLAVGTVGLNYPINEQLVTNLGLTGQAETIKRDVGGVTSEPTSSSAETYSTNLFAGANYQSLSEEIYGFEWRWDADTSLNLGYESETAFQDTESGSIGHNFQRTLTGDFLSPLRLSLSQQALVQRSSENGVTPSLFHSASLSHRSFESGVSTFARLSVSDRRDIAVSDGDEFQNARLQLDRQTEIDFRRQWLANLSLQVTRQKSSNADANVSASADGSVSYREQDLFDVANLSFLSELTLSALGLEEFFSKSDRNTETDRLRSQWRNVLQYRIGRVVASLEGTVFKEDEVLGNVVFIRLRRNFGGVF